jgi:hypothetical protein
LKRNRQSIPEHLGLAVFGLWLLAGPGGWAQQPVPVPDKAIWESEAGGGFEPGVHTLTLEAGGAYGVAAFGSRQAHHLALGSVSYGHMLGGVVNEDHWYRGNFEWRAELFGAKQFSPDAGWLVGLTAHLRYNLATRTRCVPFLDVGAGVGATGIGAPDLSNTFEFNLQAGIGVHWFVRHNLAMTAEARFLHVSCAGISHPNLGVNGVMGMIGLTRFF